MQDICCQSEVMDKTHTLSDKDVYKCPHTIHVQWC